MKTIWEIKINNYTQFNSPQCTIHKYMRNKRIRVFRNKTMDFLEAINCVAEFIREEDIVHIDYGDRILKLSYYSFQENLNELLLDTESCNDLLYDGLDYEYLKLLGLGEFVTNTQSWYSLEEFLVNEAKNYKYTMEGSISC